MTIGAARTPLVLLIDLLGSFAGVAVFVAVFGQGDGPAPSFVAVAVVVLGSFVLARALQITDEMNVGSIGLKIGLVSEAVRDLYVNPGGRTKSWDTCGPEAILAAAGGRMTDVDGHPLVYDMPDLYNRRGIVASNGPLHDFVISALVPIVAMS